MLGVREGVKSESGGELVGEERCEILETHNRLWEECIGKKRSERPGECLKILLQSKKGAVVVQVKRNKNVQ